MPPSLTRCSESPTLIVSLRLLIHQLPLPPLARSARKRVSVTEPALVVHRPGNSMSHDGLSHWSSSRMVFACGSAALAAGAASTSEAAAAAPSARAVTERRIVKRELTWCLLDADWLTRRVKLLPPLGRPWDHRPVWTSG